jgi:glycosyltransferase involved in cell wall biosynthesis
VKVGLFVGAIEPTYGGAYTFTIDLLRALVRRQSRSGHEFALCHFGRDELTRLFPQLPALDLLAHKASVLSPRERFIQRFPEVVERGYRSLVRPQRKLRWEDRIYLAEGIQFVLRFVSWPPGYNDVPFGLIVLDLEHRNTPWFPELSLLHAWDAREESYSLGTRRASMIFVSTDAGKKEIETYYQVPSERVKVLRYPVPTFAREQAEAPADPAALRRLGVPKDYLFYPAQFWPHKNHVVILEACKTVRDKTGWDLGMVFTGSDKGNSSYVRDYARRLGLEQNCVFPGFVEQSDLVALYKGAFCLVFSSFAGPDMLPPLEAFALGCPVIAPAVSGAVEQLGDAALIFPPADEKTLADYIIKLRDENVRARLIEAGRRHIRESASWDDYAGGVIDSLDKFARIRRAWP